TPADRIAVAEACAVEIRTQAGDVENEDRAYGGDGHLIRNYVQGSLDEPGVGIGERRSGVDIDLLILCADYGTGGIEIVRSRFNRWRRCRISERPALGEHVRNWILATGQEGGDVAKGGDGFIVLKSLEAFWGWPDRTQTTPKLRLARTGRAGLRRRYDGLQRNEFVDHAGRSIANRDKM